MPKLVDASEQRREIRSAARSVFARRGIRGTGLTHVARAAGMGRSSLYHYYPDKDALLRDLVQETLAEERALFRACLRGSGSGNGRGSGSGSVVERVLKLVDANVALFDGWAWLGGMIVELRLGDAKRFRRFFREIRSELAEALREGQASGEITAELEAEMSAATLIGAIDGLLFQHFIDPRALPPDALRSELRRIVERMLRP